MRPPALRNALLTAPAAASRGTGQLTQLRFKSGPYGYTQAKALVYSKYGEPGDVLSLHNHSISPSLPPSTLLLRALAAPINPADINQIQGVYPSKPPFTSFLGTASPSAVGGNEGVFEVLSASSSSSSTSSSSEDDYRPTFAKGDWVLPRTTNFGTWRTHVQAHVQDVLKIENKEGLSALQAATVVVNPCTAYRLLKDFEPLSSDFGDWIIQNGANSGVGRAAIQIASIWGIKSINVIRARNNQEETEKLKQELLALGATKVVTEEELLDQGFREKVKEWTNGGREAVKVGLNCVGGKPTQALIKCLSPSGHLVTYGGMARAPLQISTSSLIFKDYKFSGFWASRWGKAKPMEKRETIAEILDWMREGRFKDVPMQKIDWTWETEGEILRSAVDGTLGGFRKGKGIFVFGDT